jgi:hypothetical protein
MTDTSNPHTVNLMAGTYSRSSNNELFPVVPIDFVYLSGVSSDSVILDAEGLGDVMLCVICTRTTASNLSLVNGGGSGIVCQNYCAPRIENMIITGNQSGGIWVERSQPLLINLLIKGNSEYGGVICGWDCSPQLHNVTIVDNQSIVGNGGGIYCGMGSYANLNLINSIVWNNQPVQISISSENSVSITRSDVQEGAAGISITGGVLNWREGNIDDDPLFAGTGEHPFSLTAGSPCVDSGTPDTSGLYLPPGDLAGDIRNWDGNGDGTYVVDMGAYEFRSFPVGYSDIMCQASGIRLVCYPNPANGITNIEYRISNDELISLGVYSVFGKELVRLVEGLQLAGEYTLKFDASGLPPGVYLVRVEAGDESAVRKLVVR